MTVRHVLAISLALFLVLSGRWAQAEDDSKMRALLVTGASSGGSINGFIPNESDGGYAASKFAVEGYTDSLAMELAGTGVHVAIVEPGAYKSRIRDKYVASAFANDPGDNSAIDEETRQSLKEFAESNESMKDPLEVGQAVLQLMSSDAPRRRYMVTPNADQAELTVRWALQRVLQLNEGQPYALDRDELVGLLDELPKSS